MTLKEIAQEIISFKQFGSMSRILLRLHLHNDGQGVIIKDEELAKELKMSVRTVKRCKAELKRLGFIAQQELTIYDIV